MYAHLTSIINAIISCWILLNISTSYCVHIVTYIYVINLLYNISFTNLMGQNSAYITLIPSTPLKSFKSRQLTNHDKLEDFPSGSKPDAADQSFVLCVSMCVCVLIVLTPELSSLPKMELLFLGYYLQTCLFNSYFWALTPLGNGDVWTVRLATLLAALTNLCVAAGAPMNHWQTWWAWVLQRSPDANFGKRLGEAFAQDDLGSLLVSGLLDS